MRVCRDKLVGWEKGKRRWKIENGIMVVFYRE
jgi:hypothetical protein